MSGTNEETECHLTQQKPPWDIYNVEMKVNLDVWVAKATRKDSVGGVVAIRTFPKHGATIIKQRHKALHHTNLLATLEIYQSSPPDTRRHIDTESEAKEHLFVVSEYAPFTLEHVRACARPPSDGQIAAIMGQLLAGVDYLHTQGLTHGALGCPSVLVTFEGIVKIAGFANSRERHGNTVDYEDEESAGQIMRHLIHDEHTVDKKVRPVDHPRGKKLLSFLNDMKGASASKLIKHPFLTASTGTSTWDARNLEALVIDVAYSCQVDYWRV